MDKLQAVILGEIEPRLKKIILIQGAGLCSNIYILGDAEITLIDAGVGNKINRVQPVFKRLNLKIGDIKQVVLTHTHFDHIGGLIEILQSSKPVIMAHKNEKEKIEEKCKYKFVSLIDGDIVTTAIGSLKVIYTPGHTSGSMCLYDESKRILFSGDTIFPEGGFGRTDLPTGDSSLIVKSLEKLASLNVDILLAGHGDPVLKDAEEDVKRALNLAKEFFSCI